MDLPNEVRYIIDRLEANGHSAYAVGGCVRDIVMGRKPNDWDICTSARPEFTKELFKDFELVLSGIKHGTVGIIMSGNVYETTTYRIEGDYKDHRHPENVVFVDGVEGDLSRRDFTVNAMAYNEKQGIVDLFGGLQDIERGVIRCVGDAGQRFCEDALRILRALRFAARFGFDIEEKTGDALIKFSRLLCEVSQERKTAELKGLLSVEDPFWVIKRYLPVFSLVLDVDEEKLNENLSVLSRAPADFALRLGILVRNSEKLAKLRLSGADYSLACQASGCIGKKPPKTLPDTRRMVMLHKDNTRKMLEVMGAVYDTGLAMEFLKQIEDNGLCCSVKELKISGNDLISMGFGGKEIGTVLEKLLSEVIDGTIENEKEALKLRASDCRCVI